MIDWLDSINMKGNYLHIVKVVTFAQKIYIEDLNVNNRYNVIYNGN